VHAALRYRARDSEADDATANNRNVNSFFEFTHLRS
jgi:hypothetical protein